MKRIRPAPMGRAYHYVRRISHLEIVLAEKNKNGAAFDSGAPAGGKTVKAAPAKPKAKVQAKAPAKKKAVAKKATAKK
jgi:large subunit ribosomal protein L22